MGYDRSQERPRRRRWPKAEKLRIVREVAESGAAMAEVARRNDVDAGTLSRWCRTLGSRGDGAPVLVPVTVAGALPAMEGTVAVAETTPQPAARIEVVLVNGRRLTASEDIAPHRLRALVAALEEA